MAEENQNKTSPQSEWMHKLNAMLARRQSVDELISQLSADIPLLKSAADKVTAYFVRGDAYYRKGDYDHAIADFNSAIELAPNSAETYNIRGIAYSAKNEYDLAIADLTRAIELVPNNAATHNNRGNAYNGKGDYDRAIVDFSKAIELAPNNAEAHNNRGNAYNGKGNYDRAIVDFSKAITLKPNYVAAYNNRGIAFSAKGEYPKAMNDWEQAIKLTPQQNSVMVNNLLSGIKATVALRQKADNELISVEGFENREKEHGNAHKYRGWLTVALLVLLFVFYAASFGVLWYYKVVYKTGADIWEILPWITAIFLTSSPIIWAVRIANWGRIRHFALRENAYANKLMTLLMNDRPQNERAELAKKFFDHHDLRGSPQLILGVEAEKKTDNATGQVINHIIRQSGKKEE